MRLVVACLTVALTAGIGPTGADPSLAEPVGRSFAPLGEPTTAPKAPEGPADDRATEIDQLDAEPNQNQTHVVYFVPKDRQSESLDSNGVLAKSIASIREWFARETGRNGGKAIRPRFDRLTTGDWDITFVRGTLNAAEYTTLGSIRDDLIAQGFNAPNKRYLIYAAVARGNTCGEGFSPVPAIPNSGRYAAVYLDSNESCGARDWGGGTASNAGKAETIAAHEWLHNEGVVTPLAPHHCPTSVYHVCTGPLVYLPGDLDPEAPDVAFPYINAKLSAKVLDRDLDDYLDHIWPHLHDLRYSTWFE